MENIRKKLRNYLDLNEKIYFFAIISATLITGLYDQTVECVEKEFEYLEQKYFILIREVIRKYPEYSQQSKVEIGFYRYILDMKYYIDKDLEKINNLYDMGRYSTFIGNNIANANMIAEHLKKDCESFKSETYNYYTRRYYHSQKKNYLGANSWYGYYSTRHKPKIFINNPIFTHEGSYQYDKNK